MEKWRNGEMEKWRNGEMEKERKERKEERGIPMRNWKIAVLSVDDLLHKNKYN
jgi:hypothetical protein